MSRNLALYLDDEIIWDIVQTKLTPLRDCITTMKTSL